MDKQLTPASLELDRYGRRLRSYLLAVEGISKTVEDLEKGEEAGRAEIASIMQQILPHLRKAINSEISFYADSTMVIHPDPPSSVIAGKSIPLTSSVRRLLEDGVPLVFTPRGESTELDELQIDSLLAMRLNTPWETYLIGVCNGRDDPVYPSEDAKLFNTLMEILGFGLRYGQTQTERKLALERYVQAQRHGEYRFLSRASEDYARLLLPLVSYQSSSSDYRLELDDVLTDYVDAELCDVMCPPPSSTYAASRRDTSVEKKRRENLDRLLSLFKRDIDGSGVSIILHDNDLKTRPLEPSRYPRTALAIARIGLWTGYVKAKLRVPRSKDHSSHNGLDSETFRKAQELFRDLPDYLIGEARPIRVFPEGERPLLWRVDWLRTLWQRINYLARDGKEHPLQEWIKEIEEIYHRAVAQTVWVLRNYLERGRLDEGLRIDSDWLTTWMVGNVLTSESVAARFGLDNRSCEPTTTPEERMRYFAYLSQVVLYALYCAKYLLQEERLTGKFREKGMVDRPLFADIPIELSPELSAAQLYVLSEYAYMEIGVERKMRIFDRLRRQLNHELSLYAGRHFYRDHLHHVVDVCLLGELLLRSKLTRSEGDVNSQNLADFFVYLTSEAPEDTDSEEPMESLRPLLRKILLRRLGEEELKTLCVDLSINYEDLPAIGRAGKAREMISLLERRGRLIALVSSLIEEGYLVEDTDEHRYLRRWLAGRKSESNTYEVFASSEQVLADWYVAALCHDLGYVVERLGRMLEPMEVIDGPGLDDFWKELRTGIERGSQELRDVTKTILAESAPPKLGISELENTPPTDHGIVAWLHLHKWLTNAKSSSEAIPHALTAILRHNVSEQGVLIRQEPLSMLLILCDHLQEWGRPHIPPDLLASSIVEMLRFTSHGWLEQNTRVRSLLVDGMNLFSATTDFIKEDSELWLGTQISEEGLGFTLKYAESSEARFEPAISWLLFCKDLQSIGGQEKDLPCPITIKMEHTPPRIWRVLPSRPLEMDLLQDFAKRNDAATYLYEWTQKARNGEQGMKYKGARDTGIETFSIDLGKLSRPLQHGLSAEHIQEFIEWKWDKLMLRVTRMSVGDWPRRSGL